MELTDLINKAKNGDTQAFGELYEQFSDRIFRYIRIKIQDPNQAEDILQEVFIKAWNGLKTLNTAELNFSAWLYKIASNTINDYFRKYYRTPETLELDENLDIKADISLDLEIDHDHNIRLARKAMEQLPPQYKEVLELRFIQDFKIEETARIMGKTNLAIRLIQHRALKKLSEAIKQYATHE